MLNHITLMGRLTRDPELRYTQSKIPVASFTLAVDCDYGSRDGGERQTDFIDIVAWRQTAEFVSKYFTKGSMVAVSGRLQMRDWTDRDGNKRTSAEVVADNVYFGESKRREGGDYSSPAEPRYNYGDNRSQYGNYQQTAATSADPQSSDAYDSSPDYGVQTQFSDYQDDGDLPF